MEESHSGERHSDAVFVAAIDDEVVTDRAARLGDILNARLFGALDIIREGEEGIRAERDAVDGIEVGSLLLLCKGGGLFGKVLLPITVRADILLVLIDIAVDDIIAAGTTQVRTERQVQSLGMLTQEPSIGLAASQSDAVDTALLTCADTDCLTVDSKADRV